MERRVFLAIILSAAVLYGYQALFMPVPEPGATTQPSAPATASGTATSPATPAPTIAAPPPPPANQPEALISDSQERQIVIETATVRAVISNRGGRVLEWRLKGYQDVNGEPVDLVPSNIPADQPKPFSLQVDDAAVTERLNTALYRVSGDTSGRVDATNAPGGVVFEYQDASGLHARKEFRFEPRNYVVVFSARVTNGDMTLNPAIAWGPGLGDSGATSGGGSFFTGNYVQPPQAIYHRDGDVERLASDALGSQPSHEGPFRFAGIDDHYFIITAINPGQARVDYRPLAIPGPNDTQRQYVSQTIRFPQPPERVRFFAGPKQFDLLQTADQELVRSIHFGIFAWLVVPLLNGLKWLYGYVGNYGWAIILLTILINLAMFPLRHKSVVAMRKMQEIQPQMKAIQERYAHLKVTDPARQKMNTEVMNLYRERGVNPASGCVPMLLTMPVLLAFYSLLSQSIELRGAPFVGWINDLSAADPWYVIPTLMGATMFWQQKITPTTVDPAQQRIMMIMPFMFTAMMMFSPSGVVLYWFVSNLWAIGQQYFTNWMIGPFVPAGARPGRKAEHKVEKLKSGKVEK